MKLPYDDDIDDDLNRFCEDMESELKAISEGSEHVRTEEQSPQSPPHSSTGMRDKQSHNENTQKEKEKNTTTVAASPWGMSLFSSFASSATKSLSATLSPLAKDMSSITSLASSATKAFSDTLSGAPSPASHQGQSPNQRHSERDDLTAMAQTPEALAKLRRIQAEHDAKRSEMTYACLIASRSAREVAVPARSVTEIPFLVPPGQEVSWKFQVKHYDILFGVKLRVQKDDGSGEWTEHELVPLGRITSDDYIDESCCSERCIRKFIFTLDNNIAMIYSKTVAFDIITTDDKDWKQQQEEEEQQRLEEQWRYEQQSPQSPQVHGGEEVVPPRKQWKGSWSQSWSRSWSLSEDQQCQPNSSTDVEAEEDPFESQNEGLDLPPVPTSEGQEEWSMYHNDDGQAYYYNNFTEECQWEVPDGFVSNNEILAEQQEEEQGEDEEDAMAALMLKLSKGFKAGQVSAEQRQKFMADIIECRDLGEMHRDLNAIFDQSQSQQASSTIV